MALPHLQKAVFRSMNKFFVLIAAAAVSFNSFSQNTNLDLLGHYPFNEELSNLWGYVDEVGNEYALVGRETGFSIIDVTDPAAMQLKFEAPGSPCVWREVKTWGDYAYVSTECGPGLLIVDMTALPDTAGLSYTYWIDDSIVFYNAHTLFVDENGFLYLFGVNYNNGGACILDLNQDPMDPTIVGFYSDNYLHDGFVRGDTLWGSAIYNGQAQVIDVSDKTNPELLSAWTTPGVFTHNAWISDDNKFLFTTDEITNGRIAAYDVSNIYNPKELDTWITNDTGIIPHNAHFLNNYLINSHYTIGLNIIDVARPHNMVQTGIYDTSPLYNYEGFHGCWGVYPYLPSGKILASDIEEGLYVFNPTYQRACYLEGKVTDLHTGAVIYFPTVEILNETLSEQCDLKGEYAMGLADAGTYIVVVSALDYFPDTATLSLTNGQLTIHNVQLNNWPVGVEENSSVNQPFIYPNPSDGKFRISNLNTPTEVTVFDATGQVVTQFNVLENEQQIELGTLSPGHYWMRCTGQSGTTNMPLMIFQE